MVDAAMKPLPPWALAACQQSPVTEARATPDDRKLRLEKVGMSGSSSADKSEAVREQNAIGPYVWIWYRIQAMCPASKKSDVGLAATFA
ncbi:MAG: hypothetical protein WCD42_04325, partial [Rhizomicrobium sp.]